MITSLSEASFLTANANYPLPHAVPHRDNTNMYARTCTRPHVHTHLPTAPPWFDCFSLQAWAVQAVWPSDSALGLFNPLGFSQNASAHFNGEQRISTQLPQSPPLSPGVSLYLHMSKKHKLWRSLALFIPTSKSCPWSLHLPLPLPLWIAQVSHYFLECPNNSSWTQCMYSILFPQKVWVKGKSLPCLLPFCFRECAG